MNAERRKRLGQIATAIGDARLDLEAIVEEEREAFDNMPEGLQESEKGQAMSEAADTLEEACSNLDDVASTIETVQSS